MSAVYRSDRTLRHACNPHLFVFSPRRIIIIELSSRDLMTLSVDIITYMCRSSGSRDSHVLVGKCVHMLMGGVLKFGCQSVTSRSWNLLVYLWPRKELVWYPVVTLNGIYGIPTILCTSTGGIP